MRLNLSRLLIGFVLLVNLQCAVVFILWPGSYVESFELQGLAGEVALRGVGLLFLMWNVPYAIAFINPIRYRLAIYLALAMQAIGLIGETVIYATVPSFHSILRTSLSRFILFDALGLFMLIIAAWQCPKT